MGTGIKTIVMCSMALLFVSCAKEELLSRQETKSALKIHALYENSSKTLISEVDSKKAKLVWTAQDSLSVFAMNLAGANNIFSCTKADGNKADFSGYVEEGTERIVALYPYDSQASYADGILTTSIKSVQDATVSSFANGAFPALAIADKTPGQQECGAMNFTNLCAVCAFDLPSNISFAKKIKVSAKDGQKLAGKIAVDCSGTAYIKSLSEGTDVILEGTFTAGKTYCFVLAPGTYVDGFRFEIQTEAGNTYVRETTMTAEILSGGYYPLGALSLLVTETTPAASISISHSYPSGILSGTNAVLSLSGIPSEFMSALNIVAKLTNNDGVLCRSYESNGSTESSVVMKVENAYTYLPQGSYNLDVKYKNGSSKTYKIISLVAKSPAPEFTISRGGYTSYSYAAGVNGKSKNITTANSCDNSTLYALSSSVSISADLMSDPKISKSYTYTFNGSESSITGNGITLENKTGQEWAAYSWSSSCKFDGVTKSFDDMFYLTGLPYRYTFPRTIGNFPKFTTPRSSGGDGWTATGDVYMSNAVGWEDKRVCTSHDGSNGYVVTPAFAPVGNMAAACQLQHKFYCAGITATMTAYIDAVATATTKTTANACSCSGSAATGSSDGLRTANVNITMSSSKPYICLANNGKDAGWSLDYYGLYYFEALYR